MTKQHPHGAAKYTFSSLGRLGSACPKAAGQRRLSGSSELDVDSRSRAEHRGVLHFLNPSKGMNSECPTRLLRLPSRSSQALAHSLLGDTNHPSGLRLKVACP